MPIAVLLTIFALFAPACAAHADELVINDDGTALVEGTVVGHRSGCEVDGICSLTVQADGARVELIYASGDRECPNSGAAAWVHWGHNVREGSVVRAYGAWRRYQDIYQLTFCDSPDYYLHLADDAEEDGT